MKRDNENSSSSVLSWIGVVSAIMAIVHVFQGVAKVYDYGILIGCGITIVFAIIEKVSKK